MKYKIAILIVCSGICLNTSQAVISEEHNNNITARGLNAKSILNSLTRGYASTAAGGSQVVSLNLTNLLVLVLLKALIFAAGSLGTGHWKSGLGRNIEDEESIITDDEFLMYLSYLIGDYSCLQNIACHQPQQAKKYATAGDMMLKISNMLSINNDKYEYVLKELEEATNIGLAGGECSRFVCAKID